METDMENPRALRDQLARGERDLAAQIEAINARAAREIMDLVREQASHAAMIRTKLALLAAAGIDEPLRRPAESDRVAATTAIRRHPVEIMLAALEREPQTADAINRLVIDEGWSKAAAEKAKINTKRAGLTINQKRIWSLTDAGKAHIAGGNYRI